MRPRVRRNSCEGRAVLVYGFLLLIVCSAIVALVDWRRALFLWVIVGALQDPLRKITPGAPAYFVLSTVPIWGAAIVALFTLEPGPWTAFRRRFARLSSVMIVCLISLVPPALMSATYGTGSWKLTLLGVFSYGSLFLGFLIGYVYPRNTGDLRKFLGFYCLVTAITLIGVPLEYLGVGKWGGMLGTTAMGYEWVRYRGYYIVRMVAGFYRSPDVMGWHAIVMAMLSTAFALRSRGAQRWMWVGMAAWGGIGAMLCGRRKMFMMLPVFVCGMAWVHWRCRGNRRTASVVGVTLLALIVGYVGYDQIGRSVWLETYYFYDTADVPGRILAHGYRAVRITLKKSGLFGQGLGTAVQGRRHLGVNRPRTWQEGGLARIAVELGPIGFVCFLALGLALFLTVRDFTARLDPGSPDIALYAGLTGVFMANGATFIVSHQIFGDPYINSLFALLVGLLLSGAKFARGSRTGLRQDAQSASGPSYPYLAVGP